MALSNPFPIRGLNVEEETLLCIPRVLSVVVHVEYINWKIHASLNPDPLLGILKVCQIRLMNGGQPPAWSGSVTSDFES